MRGCLHFGHPARRTGLRDSGSIPVGLVSGFLSYVKEYGIASPAVYLSLGDREERTKNQVMAAVGDCIRELYGWLQEQEIDSMLEWNSGNHFKEPGIRTAKAFAWVMERTKGTIRRR